MPSACEERSGAAALSKASLVAAPSAGLAAGGPLPPVTVHLTGFGPFGGLQDNPTSILCRTLREMQEGGRAPAGVSAELLAEFAAAEIRLRGLEALEVSAEACHQACPAIVRGLTSDLGADAAASSGGRSLRGAGAKAAAEEAKAGAADAAGDGGICAIVHLGVSSQSSVFNLECRGHNVADFGIPDVRGWLPRGDPIVPGADSHLYTTLALPQILGEMHDRGIDCAISTDPGRYICNYIFYSSLHEARPAGVPVLFVHVPAFETVGHAKQVTAVLCLLLAIAGQLRGGNGIATSGAARPSETSRPLG